MSSVAMRSLTGSEPIDGVSIRFPPCGRLRRSVGGHVTAKQRVGSEFAV
jgi:hypothetical protein